MAFMMDQTVRIKNTGSSEIDGAACRVVGVAAAFPEMSYYIVLFDDPLPNGHRAMQITEHCLESMPKTMADER